MLEQDKASLMKRLNLILSELEAATQEKNDIQGKLRSQEMLADDCTRILGVDVAGLQERSNASKRQMDQDLDASAVKNLKRFLVEDYQSIAALWSLGALSDQQFWRVMTSSVEREFP